VLGIGAAYQIDRWELGIGYAMTRADIAIRDSDDDRYTLQRATLTADYELGAGIDLDGEVAYTWQHVSGPDFDDTADHYDAIEIGLGTSIEF